MNFTVSRRARIALLAGTAAAMPSLATAQDRDEMQDAQEQVDSDGDNIDNASDSGTGNMIIVTATKREQTLQETPVAVSVTTAETIERAQIRDVTDLATVVPSLRVSQSQSQFATTYSIRGFGTSGNNLGLEPSVALFVDGVYRSRAIAQISDLPDIQRVEVLRGPQSTLFGKNASAGVISIITKEPAFDLGGMVEASYGNYDAMVIKGYVTGPISETIAASVAGGYNKRDGYVTNLFNGDDVNNRDRWFARGQVLFEPSDTFKFRVIGDYDEIDEKCCATFNLQPSGATLAINAIGGQVNDFRGVPSADVIFSDVVPSSRIKNWGFSGQADWELGAVTLTSITAYRKTELDANQDVDFTSARLATGANIGQADLKTFTQELRVASDFDGPLNFLLGGYYFNEKVNTADQIVYGADFRNYVDVLVRSLSGGALTANSLEATFGAPPNTFWQAGQGFFNSMRQDNESYSAFGNVDFEVTDDFVLTLGANYTRDTKDVVTNSVSTDLFSAVNIPGAIPLITQAGIARTVGGFLGLPAGTAANAAQLAFFQTNFPTQFQAIVAGVNAQTAPLIGFRALQFLPPFQNCPNAVESCSTRDGDWSWTARLAYEVTPTLNVYASWSTGYKAPSFNLSRDSRPTIADRATLIAQGLAVTNLSSGSRFSQAENSEVWELGIKGNWGLAAANLTLFKQSIENFQTNTFTGTGFIIGNAGKRSAVGVEFDGYVRPVDQLTLNLAMTYLDPQFDSFVNSELGDLSGTEVVGVPKLSAVFGAQWDQDIGNGDHLILRGDFSYQSPIQIEPGLLAFIDVVGGVRDFTRARAAARAFRREDNNLNASVTYAFDMGLELSIWGRNLLDDRDITGVFDSVAQDESVSGYTNQPRTYGISARFRF